MRDAFLITLAIVCMHNVLLLLDAYDSDWVFLLHSSGDRIRFRAVSDTWFNSGQRVIFGQHAAVGDASLSEIFIHDNGASSLPAFEITRSAFARAAKAFPKARFFAKFDDDTYVFKSNLIHAVQQSRGWYWGYPLRPRARPSLTYASGGAGYILERSTLAPLFKCTPRSSRFEDLAVGDCMQQHGIPLTPLVGLHPAHPYQMLHWDVTNSHPPDHSDPAQHSFFEGYLSPLSYHYVQDADMRRLHQTSLAWAKPHAKSTGSSLYHFHATDPCAHNISLESDGDIMIRVWDDTLVRKHFPFFNKRHQIMSADGEHGTLLSSELYHRASVHMKRIMLRTEVLLLFGGTFVEGCFGDTIPIDLRAQEQHFKSVEQDEVHSNRLASLGIFRADEYPAAAVAYQIYRGKNWLLKEEAPTVDPYQYVMHFFNQHIDPIAPFV